MKFGSFGSSLEGVRLLPLINLSAGNRIRVTKYMTSGKIQE